MYFREIGSRSGHDDRTDIWLLEIILYVFLVCRPPFEMNSVPGTLSHIKKKKCPIPNTMSASAKDLVFMMLRKLPVKG